MTEEIIPVAKRETTGKASNNALRNSGMIPAVIYGLNEPPVAIAISPKTVALFSLNHLGGARELAEMAPAGAFSESFIGRLSPYPLAAFSARGWAILRPNRGGGG